MLRTYPLTDPSSVYSPALLFYKDLIRRNIAEAVRIARDPGRVRPHAKTHKTREIIRMALEAGITKHKCATIAEAEMVASCGVDDILIAYPIVGPNGDRLIRLMAAYPKTRFSVTADHPAPLRVLSDKLAAAGRSVEVLLDLDVGQHRTGVTPGPEAVELYEQFSKLPGLRPGGFQAYDGHNHQDKLAEREKAVKALLDPVLSLRERIEKKGWPVPRLVVGGTPTFPTYAALDLPGLECSPGTCFLHDHSYSRFADLAGFTPAALLLTRVISRPLSNRLTLDLGYKAVASDPPAGKRCVLLNVPDYTAVSQNEEHLVVETPAADKFTPGDVVYAMPTHVCPTCALHRFAYVVENGQVTEQWEIVGRDRVLEVA